MPYKIFIAFLLFTLASCSILKGKFKTLYQPNQLLSIESIDLSEDKSVLSTKNDEIMVSIIFGSEIEDTWYANGYRLDTHIFDSTSKIYIPDSITLSTDGECPKCEVWICLIEIDEDGSEDSTHQTLVNLANSIGYRALDSKTIVDAAIKDNDFLGYARIPYFSNEVKTTYDIKGQDLLDRYLYQVQIDRLELQKGQ